MIATAKFVFNVKQSKYSKKYIYIYIYDIAVDDEKLLNFQPPQMYGAAQAQCVPLTTMYLPPANAVQFYSQRPNFVQQSIPMFTGQHLTSYQYSTTPIQPATVNCK